MRSSFFIAMALLALTSCVEVVDDLSINMDGSGTFKYNINLSSSRLKVSSLLALDSLDGKAIPKLPEIAHKLKIFTGVLSKQPGISNVKVEANYVDYIVKVQCDFSSVGQLQKALQYAIAEAINQSVENIYYYYWLSWDGKNLNRSVPEDATKKLAETRLADLELLKTGSYTTISRFYSTVAKNTNTAAVISKSGSAVMIKTSAYSLLVNPGLVKNTTCIK